MNSQNAKTPEDELLAVVLDHCTNMKGTLDSWGRPAHTQAMRLLAKAGFLRINDDTGDRVRATALPEADAFLKSSKSAEERRAAIERLTTFGTTHGLSLGGITVRELRDEARPSDSEDDS
jgi:hypothetical protein